jgi:hypothetical protein
MVADIEEDNCCTEDETVDVLTVLTSSNVIHKNTVMNVKTEI